MAPVLSSTAQLAPVPMFPGPRANVAEQARVRGCISYYHAPDRISFYLILMCDTELISNALLTQLLSPLRTLAAYVRLQEVDSLSGALKSIVSSACSRIARLNGSNLLIGPGQITQARDPSASVLLLGWVCPALNEAGASYGCALTDGERRVHLLTTGASPAALYSLIAIATFSLVSHEGTLVLEAQAPICILSFSQICNALMQLSPSAAFPPVKAPAPLPATREWNGLQCRYPF